VELLAVLEEFVSNNELLAINEHMFCIELGSYAHPSWYIELGKIPQHRRYPVLIRFISTWLETKYGATVIDISSIPSYLHWTTSLPDILHDLARWLGIKARTSEWERAVDGRVLRALSKVKGYSEARKSNSPFPVTLSLPPVEEKVWIKPGRIDNLVISTGLSILLSLCESHKEILLRLRLKFPKSLNVFEVDTDYSKDQLCEIIKQRIVIYTYKG
jgi:hypothetical protein